MVVDHASEVMSTRTDFSSSRGMVQRAPEISEYKGVSSKNKYELFDDEKKRKVSGSVTGKSAIQLWQESCENKESILDKAGIDIVDVKMEDKDCFQKGGIMDPRMGPIAAKVLCQTCQQEIGCCPGHMGRIELPLPFIPYDGSAGILSKAFLHVLKCVCIFCKDLLPSPNAKCKNCKNGEKHRKIKSVSVLKSDPISVASGITVDVKAKGRSVVTGALIVYENETLFPGKNVYASEIRDILTAIEKKRSVQEIKEVTGTFTKLSCLCPQVLLVLPPIHRPDKSRELESSDKRTVGGCTTSYQNVLRQSAKTWFAYLNWKYENADNKTVRDEFYRRHELSQPKPADDTAGSFHALLDKLRSIYVTTHNKRLGEGLLANNDAKKTKKKGQSLENAFENESKRLLEMINRLFNGVESMNRNDEHAELVDFAGLWNIVDGRQSGGGKMGLPRNSALGKRTGFVARGVIIPNSHLAHTQVGMPHSFMRTLSFETGVGVYNLTEIIDEIRNPSEKDGRYIEIRIVVNAGEQYTGSFNWKFDSMDGDERDRLIGMLNRYKKGLFKQGKFVGRRLLRDGDVVMVNRQPTLQRQNLQALRVVGVDGDCLVMNPEQAKAYNLDFDGDQMNVFVPQDEMSRAELAVLHDPAALVATANGSVILGPGPSTVLGMFVLTDPKFSHMPTDREETRQTEQLKSIRLFSEIVAGMRRSNFDTLNDRKTNCIDRGAWMQDPPDYDTQYNNAVNAIETSANPWQQTVRELISLCLPYGFDATVYGKAFNSYTGKGKKYKATSGPGSTPIPLVGAWALMASNVTYMVASVDVNDNLVGVYIESSLPDHTYIEGLESIDDAEIIPRGVKTVAFGVPNDKGNMKKTLPELQIRNGKVPDTCNPPQLTGEMLKSLYNKVLHFGGGANVLATMESFQHIAHATMARLEMTASSPGDLFNAINKRSKNDIEDELLKMATKEYVSTKGELIAKPNSSVQSMQESVKAKQQMSDVQFAEFLKFSEPEQTYILKAFEPSKIVLALMNLNTEKDNKSTAIARAFSCMDDITDMTEQLQGLSNLRLEIITKLMQMTPSRTLKATTWRHLQKGGNILKALSEMKTTTEKVKALAGLPKEQLTSILDVIEDSNDRAELAEAVKGFHVKMLASCQEAISSSIIPLYIQEDIHEEDLVEYQPRLVPANALDMARYHGTDDTNTSLEALITGGTAACVQAGAQFPKGTAKDLRNMGVAIGHLKNTGMSSAETTNKSGKESPTLRDWGFVADNYITGIRYFPNFLQSQQLGIRSELEVKLDVGKVGYSARQLLLAHMSVVAGMCGEARYLCGKGEDRIVQFIYGGDGQDPHKLIPLQNKIDYDGIMALAKSWGDDTALPYPSKDGDTSMEVYMKTQCKYLLYEKSVNSKLLSMACSSIIKDNPLGKIATAQDKEQICTDITSVLRFTAPETHQEIGSTCRNIVENENIQLGQLVAFALGIVSRVESKRSFRSSVDLRSAMAIAKRTSENMSSYLTHVSDDSPLWSICGLIRSNALVGLLSDESYENLLITQTKDEDINAIYDSMNSYWGTQCQFTPTVCEGLKEWCTEQFSGQLRIRSLYTANLLLERIPCPLTVAGTLNTSLLSYEFGKVTDEMVNEFRLTISRQCLLKCYGDILSEKGKKKVLLDEICNILKNGDIGLHKALSSNLEDSTLTNAIIGSLQATLSKLPSRHIGLYKECKKIIKDEQHMQLGCILAFVCIVVNRLEYSRIEYGAPIGGWAVEALMSDIQQAALDAKHGISKKASAKDRFKELVEFPYSNDPTVTLKNSERLGRDYFEHSTFSAEMASYSQFYIHGRTDKSINHDAWWGVNSEAMSRCSISEASDAQFTRGIGVCIEFKTEEVAIEFCKHLTLPSYKDLKSAKPWQLSMGAKLVTKGDDGSKRFVQVGCTAAEAPLHYVLRKLTSSGVPFKMQVQKAVEKLQNWGAIGDGAIQFLTNILLQVVYHTPEMTLRRRWKLLKQKVIGITSALHGNLDAILQDLKDDVMSTVFEEYRHNIESLVNSLEERYENKHLAQYLASVLIHVNAESDAVRIIISSIAKFKTDVWMQLFEDPIDLQDFIQLRVSALVMMSLERLKSSASPNETSINGLKRQLDDVKRYQAATNKEKHTCVNEPAITLHQDDRTVILRNSHLPTLNGEFQVERDATTGAVIQCTPGPDDANDDLVDDDSAWYSWNVMSMIETALENTANGSKRDGKTLLETCMNKLNNNVMSALRKTYGTGIPGVVQAFQDKEDVLRNIWCLQFNLNGSASKAASSIGQTDAKRSQEQVVEHAKRTRESPLLYVAHKLFTNKTEIQNTTMALNQEDRKKIEDICTEKIESHSSYEDIMDVMRKEAQRIPDTREAQQQRVDTYRNAARGVIDQSVEDMEMHYVMTGEGCPYPTSSSMSLTLDVDNPPIVQAACGIEIARLVMRQELDKLFATSGADPRHAQILADTLSIDGFLRGIRRSDVAEVRTPLELSAYERIQNALNTAALKNLECDEDTVHVAAMYNRPPQLGTGVIGSDLRRLPQCHNLMSVITQASAYTEPEPSSTVDSTADSTADAMDVDSGEPLIDAGGDSDNDMLEML